MYTYPDLSNSELEKQSLSRLEAVSYGKSLGLNPKLTNSRLSWSTTVSEIDADRPVYFSCDLLTGDDGMHALVCRGYNKNGGNPFYSVWNPRYLQFETMYACSNVYASPTRNYFEYVRTIYN